MKNLAEIVATLSARAVRADMDSKVVNTEKERNFHVGRYEAYLQSIAEIADKTVAEIRAGIAPTRERKR